MNKTGKLENILNKSENIIYQKLLDVPKAVLTEEITALNVIY